MMVDWERLHLGGERKGERLSCDVAGSSFRMGASIAKSLGLLFSCIRPQIYDAAL